MITKLLKLLLLSIIAVLTPSCMVDKISITHFAINNESSHDIEIKFEFASLYSHIPDNVELCKGESVSFKEGTAEGDPVLYPHIYKAYITFDSDIEIVHRHTAEYHSICNESDCKFEKKSEYEGTYTFTFTDADYEYAVSQQTE